MDLLDGSRATPLATPLVTRRSGEGVPLAIALALGATFAAACSGCTQQRTPTADAGHGAQPTGDGGAADGGDASIDGGPVADAGRGDAASTDGSTPAATGPLRTSGSKLLDRCGRPILIRGLEQRLRTGIPVDNQWAALIDKLSETGANAVRILPDLTNGPSNTDLDAVLARVVAHDLVVFITVNDTTWFGHSDVKALLAKYQGNLILDAFAEPAYDDRARWYTDVTAAIDRVRGYGYRVPVVVMANGYGRDLPSLLDRGADVVAHDPEHNVILGWQAYWGTSNTYQAQFGMTLAQGFGAAGAASFPIQAGIDDYSDPGEHMDYVTAMSAAQADGVGWLWWDWHNPPLPLNSLSVDGTVTNMTAVGQVVVETDPASLRKTSVKACTPP